MAAPRRPDYSAVRRRYVLSLLRESSSQASWCGLDDDAKVLYALGALVCNEAGVAKKDDLYAVAADRSALNYAAHLLKEAGAA